MNKPNQVAVKGEVTYKVRHKPTGQWLARSFSSAKPWSLVKYGGRVFTHPKYVTSMIAQKIKTGLKEAQMIRWGLGKIEDYEIVPFIMLEDRVNSQPLNPDSFDPNLRN